MIELQFFEFPRIPLYDNEDILLGYVNEYELLNARIQICKQGLEGYYVLLNGDVISINKYGMFDNQSNCFPFDTQNLVVELFTTGINIRKQSRKTIKRVILNDT